MGGNMVINGNHHLAKDDHRLGRDRRFPPIDSVAESPVHQTPPDDSIYTMEYVVIVENNCFKIILLSYWFKLYNYDIYESPTQSEPKLKSI